MWTALSLGAAILAGGAAYLFWAAGAISGGAHWLPYALGLPLIYLVFPLLFTTIWGFLGWWWRAKAPAEAALGAGQWLRLYFYEFLALATSAPKMVSYRLLLRDPPPAPADNPILLLHGLGCNAGIWTGFAHRLGREKLGPVYTLSYGPPLASIEIFAEQLAAKIAEIRAATGAAQVTLITHSMGGLVARAFLRRRGAASVRMLLTIGAPHHGSRHAWLMVGTALAQMRPGSAFLEGLNAESAGRYGVPILSLWSWHDTMVTPQTSARLSGARNVALAGVAHNALLNDRGVWDRAIGAVRADRSRPADEVLPARDDTASGGGGLGRGV